MDPIVYFLADYFPWWGIPSAIILAEIANHFRRTGKRLMFLMSAFLCFTLVGMSVAYFVYSGFTNLRPAMRNLEKTYVK